MKKKMSIIKRSGQAFDDLSQAPPDWYVGRGREKREEARVKKLLEKPGAELGTRLYAGKKPLPPMSLEHPGEEAEYPHAGRGYINIRTCVCFLLLACVN